MGPSSVRLSDTVSAPSADVETLSNPSLVIVTDAWHPLINGVTTVLERMRDALVRDGWTVEVIGPHCFRTLPCPTYPEVRLAVDAMWQIPKLLRARMPSAVHIATEGPVGSAARRWCLKTGHPFSSSFHTRFPEYIHARCRLPIGFAYNWFRKFHASAEVTMVSTPGLRDDLAARGFTNLELWSLGVDLELFRPRPKGLLDLPRPIFMNVGRMVEDKNLDAFFGLDLPGSKVAIGSGPQLPELQSKFPDVHFLGPMAGETLAAHFADADVFVFPSHTDTFGLVQVEALASGVPVAAFPVQGPLDIIGAHPCGVLDEDLKAAALRALAIDPTLCRRHAERFSWDASYRQFRSHLQLV